MKRRLCGNELQKGKKTTMYFVHFQHLFLPMQLKYKTQFMKIKAELKKE